MNFLAGLGVGIVMGLLFAPTRGEETRRQLLNKAAELAELPRRKAAEMAEAAKERAGDLGAKIGREAAQAAVETVTNRAVR